MKSGKQLKLARVSAGVTQAKVAALLGISQAVLYEIEAGRRPVNEPECAAVEKAIALAVAGMDPAVVPFKRGRQVHEENKRP